MALKDIFKMTKANRYTADGREDLIKAQEAEVEDRRYKIGEISEKTGLQKTANGWVKPNKGGAGRNLGTEQKKRGPGAIHTPGKGSVGIDKMKEAAEKGLKGQELKEFMTGAKSESKPAESTSSAPSTIKYEDAQKAINNGQIVQWKDSDGVWHDVDPKTSELVMARDIGSKLRVKTDENGNPVKAKPEPGMDETRSKLLELEKRRKKFEKYPDMDNSIKLQQAALLSKAGFGSRAEFEEFAKSEIPSDSAPRILTGDTRIRVRK